MKRSQTATEYLIILAVVIIIALIVVGVMGGFSTQKPSVKETIGRQICAENNMTFDQLVGIPSNIVRCKTSSSITTDKYNLTSDGGYYYAKVNWIKYEIC